MYKKVKLAWISSIVLILSPFGSGRLCSAQTITGSIRGTVTDPSGAVVQRANITATNVDTGVNTHTVTDRSGLYNIQFLPIGNYKVSVGAPGFAGQQLGPFALQIDQIASINAKLSLGGSSETISVSADTSSLNTENATVSTSINSQTLENMPLNGLNVQIASLFVPGAVIPDQSAMSGPEGTERDAYTTHGAEPADAQPTFNGNRQQNNSYILDGIDINETLNNAVGYNPSPFSIQEVHVITSNADAEFGNVNGGEVVMVTKGGTNHIHGTAFEYHENSGLTANTWANKNNATIVPRANFNQNQFGIAVGGPIIKNKLFIFGNYIGLWRSDSGIQQESVPTAAERGQAVGDTPGFADLSGVASVEGIPLETYPNGTNNPVLYPNSQVPILNPVAIYIFQEALTHPALLPLPNTTAGSGGLTDNNFNGPFADSTRNNQGDVRIDYSLNNNTFMGKFSRGEAYDIQSQVPMEVLFPASNDYPFTNVSLAYTHIFSPKVVNNLRGGFTRIVLNQNSFTDPSGLFGLHGDQTVGIPLTNQQIAGFSYMSFSNNSDLSNWGTAYYLEAYNLDNNFDYSDTLTWEHGNHITKFGADFVRYQQDYFAPSNIGGENGNFTYSGSFTDYSYADFLTDQASTNQIAGVTGPFGQRQWRDAVFVQDDWRVRPNITINLGLRYAYDQPIYEVNNKMVNVNLKLAEFAPVGTPISNMLEYAGAYNPATGKVNSRALYNPYYYNFMPRFGFAWTLKPRLVLRGGFGITDELESTGTGLRMTQNPPYQPSFVQNAPLPGPTTPGGPALAVENGFQVSAGNNTDTNGSSYRAWDPDIHPATTSQINLTTEYLIGSNTTFSIGYVGQISKHLAVPIALNQYTEDVPAVCDATCYQTIIPFNQLVGQGGEVIETASRADANYNSLQATIRRQQSKGLMFIVNYAYSKSLTNNPGYFNVDSGSDEDSYWQDINHPNEDYGPSNFDLRHNISGTMVYQLPFGRGKQFGSTWSRFADEVVGDWQFATNFEIHTGFPLGIVASPHCNDNCPEIQTGDYFAPAEQYRHMKIVGRGRQPNGTFNFFGNDPSVTPCSGHGVDNGICAYGKIADFGNSKPGAQYGPAFDNWDLALQKGFTAVGKQNLVLRVDAFNAFNIASYANPGTNTGSPSAFGVITGTRSGPRTLQLSVVYKF